MSDTRLAKRPALGLVLTLGFGGFFAGIVVAMFGPLLKSIPGYFLIGTLFGATISFSLRVFEGVRTLWKLLVLTAVASIALPLSALTCFYLEFFSPWPTHTPGTSFAHVSNIALFVGGTVGAFLILTVLLLSSKTPGTRPVFNALCWSLVGGVLGVVGWNLGPWLGTTLWSLQQSLNLTLAGDKIEYAVAQGRTGMCSLLLVWPTGMGLLTGIAFVVANSLGGEIRGGEAFDLV